MSPTFFQSLVAGAAAGTSVDLLFFPLDTLKTRLQSPSGFAASGGFRGIYKGIGSVFVGSAPGAATFFCTYDTLKNAGHHPVVAAWVGEVAACLIRVPTEVIKTRTQTSHYAGASSTIASWHVAKQVYLAEGLRGFYTGYFITIMREVPFSGIQFPLYEGMKAYLSRTRHGGKPVHLHEAAICGSISGGIAAFLTTPLDVMKTRIMLNQGDTAQWMRERVWTIYRSESRRALFAGGLPRTLWISVGGAVFLGIYEATVRAQTGA